MHVCQATACKGNKGNMFCRFSRDFANGGCVIVSSNKGRDEREKKRKKCASLGPEVMIKAS